MGGRIAWKGTAMLVVRTKCENEAMRSKIPLISRWGRCGKKSLRRRTSRERNRLRQNGGFPVRVSILLGCNPLILEDSTWPTTFAE